MDREQYAGYLAMQGLADQTIRNYTAMYQRWCDYAVSHDRDPQAPDPLTVRAFSAQLTGGRSIVAHARATISHACVALDTPDVSAAIPLPRQPRQHKAALDHDKATQLAQVARRSGLKGLAVLVGLYTAARRSEIASLSWRRIDLDALTVTLDRPKTRDLHTIPLHPRLAEVLVPRRVPGEVWVFPGRYGGHVSPARVWEWVTEVADDAGIGHVTPHMLRRTALTEANDSTRDLRAVQDLAGHADPGVTAIYTRASQTRMVAAVDALDF